MTERYFIILPLLFLCLGCVSSSPQTKIKRFPLVLLQKEVSQEESKPEKKQDILPEKEIKEENVVPKIKIQKEHAYKENKKNSLPSSPPSPLPKIGPTPNLPSSTPSSRLPSVPITINPQVQAYINFYTKNPRGRIHFQKTLMRAREYQQLMEGILTKAGLPKELFYLAFIESGFNNHAYSRSHACGPWQFIASTARKYGLKIDYWVDERRDPELATKAAAKYLSDLYAQFHDWYLAAAAYNAGDGLIQQLVKKYKIKDFWVLAKKAHIKRETKYYVPKWLATIVIARNPQKYGFKAPQPLPWKYEKIETSALVDISFLAKKTKIGLEKLKHLNPALKTVFAPPYDYFIRVPKEKKDIVLTYLEEQEKITQVFSHFCTYQVQPGDSLWKIARKFHKDISFIAKLNNLSFPYLLHPGQKLIIPYGEPKRQIYTERDEKTGKLRIVYTVKSGDSLWKIARQFNTSVAELKRVNKTNGLLHPGDQLVIPLPSKIIIYEVKKGDTLWDIARKFNTTPKEIMSSNNLSSPIIHPGDKLKIKSSS